MSVWLKCRAVNVCHPSQLQWEASICCININIKPQLFNKVRPRINMPLFEIPVSLPFDKQPRLLIGLLRCGGGVGDQLREVALPWETVWPSQSPPRISSLSRAGSWGRRKNKRGGSVRVRDGNEGDRITSVNIALGDRRRVPALFIQQWQLTVKLCCFV